jgi:predicted nucleic acid-binding protein
VSDAGAAVVDANVLCDALLPSARRDGARRAIEPYTRLVAPELLRLEVVQVLRRYARGDSGDVAAAAIVHTVRELDLEVVPTVDILPRVWELGGGLTCYDAAYLAA